MNQIDQIPDRILPFHKHALSQLHLQGDDGPFPLGYAHMTEGAYNAVWLGITFTTPFSIHNQMLFTSYQDFQLACEEAGNPKTTYFCDEPAHRTANPSHNINLAKDYCNTLS